MFASNQRSHKNRVINITCFEALLPEQKTNNLSYVKIEIVLFQFLYISIHKQHVLLKKTFDRYLQCILV